MKKILVAALLSTVVTAPLAADSGGYVGVTVGRSKTDNPYPLTTTTKDNETVGGIFAGYQFDKNWGAEVFYANVGKLDGTCLPTCTAFTTKGDAVGINLVGTVPISDTFSLYAKLGVASTKTDTSAASNVPIAFTGDRRSAVTGGVGAQYNINKNVGIRLGWDGYEQATHLAGTEYKPRPSIWSMGAVFKF